MTPREKQTVASMIDNFIKENGLLFQDSEGYSISFRVENYDDFIKKLIQVERHNTEYYGAFCCLMTTKSKSWTLEELYDNIFKKTCL